MVIEELLKFFVGEVDTELLKAVVLLETKEGKSNGTENRGTGRITGISLKHDISYTLCFFIRKTFSRFPLVYFETTNIFTFIDFGFILILSVIACSSLF